MIKVCRTKTEGAMTKIKLVARIGKEKVNNKTDAITSRINIYHSRDHE